MSRNLLLSILSLCCISSVLAQSEEEFAALVSLYYSTSGPNWAQSWDLGRPVLEWEGIVLEDGHVVEIHLPFNRLEGELPENFYQLKHLKRLNLAYNKLSGHLSSQWKRLHSLEELRLSQNEFSGAIPPGLKKMKSLKALYLADNSFSDYTALLELRQGQLSTFDLLPVGGNASELNKQLQLQLSNTVFADEQD